MRCQVKFCSIICLLLLTLQIVCGRYLDADYLSDDDNDIQQFISHDDDVGNSVSGDHGSPQQSGQNQGASNVTPINTAKLHGLG